MIAANWQRIVRPNPPLRMHAFAAIVMGLFAFGCTSTSPQLRRQHAERLGSAQGWEQVKLPAGDFVLIGYVPKLSSNSAPRVDQLTVYIEGDGFAWRSRRQPSEDPTPLEPVALELALKHSNRSTTTPAAYLARPCQYVEGADARRCDEHYWTTRRFAPEVIVATDRALDALKQRHGAKSLVLVGYSGGGVVAALIAARRTDVARLVTVAAPLDHRAWTTLHNVTALDGSLNPADLAAKLQAIPQVHFVGAKDTVVPVAVAEAYRARFQSAKRPEIRVIPDFNHTCCWAERWPMLQAQAFPFPSE